MAGSRTLGISLLVGAAAVLGLMLLWLAVSGAQGGGIVLGLLLALVLAGPLGAAGWYVLSRQKAEEQESRAFITRQRIIDADRRFRIEMADTLRALAARPSLPADRLRELAADVERPLRGGPGWADSIQLDDAQLSTLTRYDDLVRGHVRGLRDDSADAEALMRELRAALDARDDLLLRGRLPAGVDPSTLLRSGEPRRGAEALTRLRLGDAVSRIAQDYIVEGVATYTDADEAWHLFRLNGPEAAPVWLYVGPGALQVALVDEVPRIDAELREQGRGTATVDVAARTGTAQGVLVSYARFADAARIGFSERWPDGATHQYLGEHIRADDLEVWPADLQPANG